MQYGFAIRKFWLFKPYLIVTGFGREGDGNWYLYPLGKDTWVDCGGGGKIRADEVVAEFWAGRE